MVVAVGVEVAGVCGQETCASPGHAGHIYLQGYLAQKKQPPLLGQPYDSRHSPNVGPEEGCVSYERGTAVALHHSACPSSLKWSEKLGMDSCEKKIELKPLRQ